MIATHQIEDLAVLDTRSVPTSGSRGPREIAATDGEFTVLLINRSGRETVRQGCREIILHGHQSVLWDSSRPAWFTAHEPVVKRSLLVPTAALVDAGSRGPLSDPADVPPAALRLMQGLIGPLVMTSPDLPHAVRRAARDGVVDLLRQALRPGTRGAPDGVIDTADLRRIAVERYVDAHLGQRDISAAAVAAAQHIAVRTLNRLFSATGETYSEVVRGKRLERVRLDLLGGNDTVTALAARWAFTDASHLARSFRLRYGMSPSEYREHRGARP